MLKNKLYLLKNSSIISLNNDPFKKGSRKFYASVISILLGFLASFLILILNNNNPINFYIQSIGASFNHLFIDQTITTWCCYIIGGLALVVGFKSKVFNIGVAGQMLLAGSLICLFGIIETHYINGVINGHKISQGLFIFISLLIAIVAGIAMALIPYFLKRWFKINEVVSSLLLNYAIFYFCNWLFQHNINFFENASLSSKAMSNAYSINIAGYNFVLPLILSFIAVIFVYFLFKYTTFGYKLKSVGSNKYTSKYGGIKIQRYLGVTFILSGALSGLLGFCYYLGLQHGQVNFSSSTLLPIIGFNCIAVALVAFNNAIGVVLVSILWSVFSIGTQIAAKSPVFNLSRDLSFLLFGIVIYFAAISNLFIHYKPYKYIKKLYIFKKSALYPEYQKLKKENKQHYIDIKKRKKELKNEFLSNNKNKNKLYWNLNFNNINKDKKINYLLDQIKYKNKEKKYIINEAFKNYNENSIYGIKQQYKKENINERLKLIQFQKYEQNILNDKKYKYLLSNKYSKNVSYYKKVLKNQKINLKNNFQNQITQQKYTNPIFLISYKYNIKIRDYLLYKVQYKNFMSYKYAKLRDKLNSSNDKFINKYKQYFQKLFQLNKDIRGAVKYYNKIIHLLKKQKKVLKKKALKDYSDNYHIKTYIGFLILNYWKMYKKYLEDKKIIRLKIKGKISILKKDEFNKPEVIKLNFNKLKSDYWTKVNKNIKTTKLNIKNNNIALNKKIKNIKTRGSKW